MAARCATLAELIALAPEFSSVGTQSTAELVVSVAAATGTLTLLNDKGALPVQETFTAGVDWVNGLTPALTAEAIAAALTANSTLVEATSIDATVYVASIATGYESTLAVSSDDASMTWSTPTLEGGDAALNHALLCTCSMINIDCWGIKASCGHAYLAAHFLALETGIGTGGTVKRRRIDKLEIEFGTYVPSSSIESTNWGQAYEQMKKTLFIVPLPGRGVLACL